MDLVIEIGVGKRVTPLSGILLQHNLLFLDNVDDGILRAVFFLILKSFILT
jgi:hypothetical protein